MRTAEASGKVLSSLGLLRPVDLKHQVRAESHGAKGDHFWTWSEMESPCTLHTVQGFRTTLAETTFHLTVAERRHAVEV